jgi:hypothetical protein
LRNENESGETILPENLKLINHLNIKMNKFKSQSNLKPERLNQFNSRATPWVRKRKPIIRAESPGEKNLPDLLKIVSLHKLQCGGGLLKIENYLKLII